MPEGLPGPWLEIRRVGPGLVVVDGAESLSRVYHEVKWALPDGTALLVSPLGTRPKLKGLLPGTQTWLWDRLPAPVADPAAAPSRGGER